MASRRGGPLGHVASSPRWVISRVFFGDLPARSFGSHHGIVAGWLTLWLNVQSDTLPAHCEDHAHRRCSAGPASGVVTGETSSFSDVS